VTVPLYLRATEYLPGKPESFFEMGYLLFERRSIFVICFVVWFNSFGLMLIYFILFAQTMQELVKDFGKKSGKDFGDSVLIQQWFYAAILGLMLIPIIIKKQLEELSIVAFSLFALVLIFVLLLILQLGIEDTYNVDF